MWQLVTQKLTNPSCFKQLNMHRDSKKDAQMAQNRSETWSKVFDWKGKGTKTTGKVHSKEMYKKLRPHCNKHTRIR